MKRASATTKRTAHKVVYLRLRPDVHKAAVAAANAAGAHSLTDWCRRVIAEQSGFARKPGNVA